jgi:pimeloyl-ACP methyl ester carboxylesterase
MIYTQPVVQDLPRLSGPALLVIGQSDRTTLGRGALPPEVLATLGRYPELGKRAARAIPGAKLVELEGVGHIPHIEAPERFHAALIEFLSPQL